MDFYTKTVRSLGIQPQDAVLVVCGGPYDAKVLHEAGLRNVTVSNLMPEGHASRGTDYGDFAWSHQDAEKLSFPDASFDWAVVHAGLHHCASPHAAVLEMVRVARKGVLVIEARDSALMRLAVRLGFSPEYELESVALAGFRSGGVRDTSTPNYIYRWTEREVVKLVESAHPDRENRFAFSYHLAVPHERMTMVSGARRLAMRILAIGVATMHWIFPKQCNEFGFAITWDGKLKPWMGPTGLRPDYQLGFDPKKYRPESGGV